MGVWAEALGAAAAANSAAQQQSEAFRIIEIMGKPTFSVRERGAARSAAPIQRA